jgi:hypothetical protein
MKKRFPAVAVILCALTLTSYGELPQESQNSSKTEGLLKTKSMPDFCQLDSRLPNRGKQFCGPAAVSNALVWLAMNGHRDLVPFDADAGTNADTDVAQAQYNVIRTLGSEHYMKTVQYAGTDPIDVLIGLDKYVRSCGYEPAIEWKGYREGGKYARGPIPELEWMTRGFDGKYNVVLEIGWYNYCSHCQSYKRTGGHYVTLTGVKFDGNTPQFIVHNPSVGGGLKPKPQVCTLKAITEGTLAPWSRYSKRPAKGYYTMDGLTMPYNAKIAILEGAVKFTVRDPREQIAERPIAKPVMGMTGF